MPHWAIVSPSDLLDPLVFVTTFTTLVVIQDPLGNLPVFLALTARMSRQDRIRAARLATLVSLTVIVVFAVMGKWLLMALHITVPALQLAGGLLLLLVALELLMGRGLGQVQAPTGDQAALDVPRANMQVALVPLGTPLMAGPGAIVAVMLAMEGGDPATWTAVAAAVLLSHLVCWLSMRFGLRLHRVLGDSIIMLVTRLSGMLLAAIAVQLASDAVMAFIDVYLADRAG